MASNKEKDLDMADFYKHRFDDDCIEALRGDTDDDDDLAELEDREYWRNVLSDELRRWR